MWLVDQSALLHCVSLKYLYILTGNGYCTESTANGYYFFIILC
jgi:hypothetical protein